MADENKDVAATPAPEAEAAVPTPEAAPAPAPAPAPAEAPAPAAPQADPNAVDMAAGGSSVDAAMAAAQSQAESGSKKTFYMIVGVLVIAIIIAGAYLLYSRSNTDDTEDTGVVPVVYQVVG